MCSILKHECGEKLRAITIFAVFICLLLALSQTANASGTFRATAGVNVRESASETSKTLTTVNQDASVDVLEHNPAGWSKVQVGSTIGYIRSDFLKLSIGDTPAVFTVSAAAGVNIRETASTSAKSLAALSLNDKVNVLEHNPAGWSKVQAGDITGYIKSDFLKHAPTATANSTNDTSNNAAPIGQYKTIGDDVRLRESSSTTSRVIMVLVKNATVDVLENNSNGWSKVTVGSDTGYIRSDLIAPVSAPAVVSETQTRYTVGNVNLRSSASAASNSNFIRTITKGSAVEVIEDRSDGWSKVIHSDREGFIKTELLTTTAQVESQTMYTSAEGVRIRARASTSSSILKVLSQGTEVTVLAVEGEWSRVKQGDTTGYIRSDLLSAQKTTSNTVIATMVVTAREGANLRTGPSTSHSKITALPFGTSVTVYANESNGWSRVKAGNTEGYIKTDLLGAGSPVELVTMSEISHLLPVRENVRVVDVRTGVSYNIKIFSKGTHADYETSTLDDTNTMFSLRNGVRSWAARPLWVYVGNRVFAAASHGQPHDVDWIKNNGIDGHLCLHFNNATATNKSYQNDLRKAVQEAYDKRPR